MDARSIALPAASGYLITGMGCITYWSTLDTTASSGSQFALYDGDPTDGQLLLEASTTAGQSTSEYIQRGHCCYQRGLYYDLLSGSYGGAVSVWASFSAAEWQAFLASLVNGS